MSKKKKSGKQADPTSIVLLITAITELIKALIELISKYNE